MGLLTSTINVIGSLTNFGLGTSAVKDISVENASEDKQRISTIVTVFHRLVWITGTFGSLLALVLSPWLSQLTFGNNDYTLAIGWISITLLFNQLSKGELVILQGIRKLKLLAKANLLGSSLGLLVTLPMYYYWGIDGIVPGIIGSSLVTLLAAVFYSRKVTIKRIKISYSGTIEEGRNMLQMGFMISLSSFLSIGASYIVRIFISHKGGVEEVGLYNAGFAIINTYVGLIFAAMGTDYYPRLSAVAYDNKLCRQTINQQAEIGILILAPILVIFLIFINWVVIILYSKQFIAVNDMIYWATLGMFFKTASWSISYVFLAKGASKLFFWNELIANIYVMGFNIIGYYFFGLIGLGISFTLSFLIYLVQVFIVSKIKYEFSFDKEFINIFIFQFGLGLLGFLAINYLIPSYAYFAGALLVLVSGWFSFKELHKRINIKQLLRGILKNKK